MKKNLDKKLLEEVKRLAEEHKSYLDSLPLSSINLLVRIAGTDYDRRRKTDVMQREMMRYLYIEKGLPISYVSKILKVSDNCVRYNTNPKWKAENNANRTKYKNYNNSHFKGEQNARAEYKLELLEKGKLAIQ